MATDICYKNLFLLETGLSSAISLPETDPSPPDPADDDNDDEGGDGDPDHQGEGRDARHLHRPQLVLDLGDE